MLKIYRTFLILNRSPIYRKLLAVIQLLKSLFEREDCIASVPVWKIKILSYYIDRILLMLKRFPIIQLEDIYILYRHSSRKYHTMSVFIWLLFNYEDN